jgi:L-Ala-D/L-Glu epimerase
MQLILHTHKLKLRHTFTITHESRDVQPTLIVELRDGNVSGYGEATETPYYGVTMEKMIAELECIRPLIEQHILGTPESFFEVVRPYLYNSYPFALAALDMATNDLWGKKLGKPLYQAWGLNADNNPITDYTIGIDTIEKMVMKMKEVPFPLYKIKLGTHEDIRIIEELRKHTEAVFRVDANTAL